MKKLGERQIVIDCDVIQADGGTRTASISGAWVALRLAVDKLLEAKAIAEDPIEDRVAAISCGMNQGTPVLDLDYDEDSNAERSEEHTSELQSLMRSSYAVFCLK